MNRQQRRRIAVRRPSAPMIVAVIALVAALGGESIAGVATKALTKKEKKQTKRIAAKQVSRLAPGLSVGHANTASKATTATNATNAGNAATVDGQSVLKWNFRQGNGTLGSIGAYRFEQGCDGDDEGIVTVRRTVAGSSRLALVGSTSSVEVTAGYSELLTAWGGEKTVGFHLAGGDSTVSGTVRFTATSGGVCVSSGVITGG